MELTIADSIRKKDIFIGHDWLQHHNPEIDWQDKKIKFSRCPGVCYQTSEVNIGIVTSSDADTQTIYIYWMYLLE